jgi:hypothetical protein
MKAMLCDGIERVSPPPEGTPSHYHARQCLSAIELQQQLSLDLMRWYEELPPSGTARGATLDAALAVSCLGRLGGEKSGAGCGGNGVCVYGTCACFDGWWGIDCTERRARPVGHAANASASAAAHTAAASAARSGDAASRAASVARGLRVYIYTPPPELGTLRRARAPARDREPHLYGTEDLFLSRLLADTTTRCAEALPPCVALSAGFAPLLGK